MTVGLGTLIKTPDSLFKIPHGDENVKIVHPILDPPRRFIHPSIQHSKSPKVHTHTTEDDIVALHPRRRRNDNARWLDLFCPMSFLSPFIMQVRVCTFKSLDKGGLFGCPSLRGSVDSHLSSPRHLKSSICSAEPRLFEGINFNVEKIPASVCDRLSRAARSSAGFSGCDEEVIVEED
jgi:hypothetical protein